jgi:transposase
MRVPSKLKLATGQVNSLRLFMEKTSDKKEYRRAVAVLQKADGKTYHYIAIEHIRTAKKWVGDYIKNGIEDLKIRENHGGRKPRITNDDRETILSALFNDPHLFGYLGNTWSLRSLAKCLTNDLRVPISFKHLQRITKDLGIICKRPKLELLHGKDYEEGKKRVEDYKHVAKALKKRES